LIYAKLSILLTESWDYFWKLSILCIHVIFLHKSTANCWYTRPNVTLEISESRNESATHCKTLQHMRCDMRDIHVHYKCTFDKCVTKSHSLVWHINLDKKSYFCVTNTQIHLVWQIWDKIRTFVWQVHLVWQMCGRSHILVWQMHTCKCTHHTATHCNTLQHTATRATWVIHMQHSATQCNTLQHVRHEWYTGTWQMHPCKCTYRRLQIGWPESWDYFWKLSI